MGMDQDDLILAPYTTIQKKILAITHLQGITCSALKEEYTDQAIDEISEILRRNHRLRETDDDDFTIRSMQELSTMLTSTTDIMTTLLAAVAGISLLVGGIGIMNIMYVSVTERTREIGLRMSIGAKGMDILAQFLIESILISVTGGLIGVLFGVGAALIVNVVAHFPIYIQPWSVLYLRSTKEDNKMNDTPQSPPIKGLGKLIHIAGWGILFCSPFFFTGRESQVTFEGYFRSIIVPLSFLLGFYLNYGWLVRRYLFNRRTGRFLLINLLLIGGMMLFVHLCMRYFYPPEMHHPPRPPRPLNETVGFFLVNAVIYSLVAGLSVAIKMTDGWYRVAAIQRELEKERAEAELQNLKSQLNPHFLFNTLNNIYSLIAFSPEKAQEAVHDLSRLLRYVLYESSQPFVSLEKDFDFLRNYVELMRIRLPKHVELKTNIVASSPGTLIAPLLFISLVENAFKHGVSNNKPSFIHLDIHQEGAEVVCTIVNSYFPKSPDQDKSGSGIGLVNLEKRLGLLYPGHFSFQCGREGDNYSSYLSITINETEI